QGRRARRAAADPDQRARHERERHAVRALFFQQASRAGPLPELAREGDGAELSEAAPAEPVVVGVDGGGTTFRAVVVDAGGAEVGRQARVGGWGSLLGDEGSGYAIGLEALRRIARSVDRRDRDTDLARRVLVRLGLSEPQDLIAWSSTATRAAIAGLVPEV